MGDVVISAAFTTNQICDPSSFLTHVCMHTTLWFISLHWQWDSTAVSEKKLIQMWFPIIIMYQITQLSLSTGLVLQCTDSFAWGDLKEAHLNLDISDFSPVSKAVKFIFLYTPTKQFLTHLKVPPQFFFTIRHQAWELFILFCNLILVIRIFRVSSFLTNRTAVERHDILKSDRTFSSSKLSPCRTIKHKNLVPLI